MQSIEMLDPMLTASLRGEVAGRQALVFNVIGRRETFVNTTAQHDIAEFLDGSTLGLVDMAGDEPLEIVSTSANDAAAGSGIRTVRITYVDANGNLAEKQALGLNGVTPIAAGFTAKAILFMETETAGSGSLAAGAVTLRKVSGAVPVEQIAVGGNKSMSGRFMVPKGYEAYISGYAIHAIRQNMDCRMRATVFSKDRTLDVGGLYRFQDVAYAAANVESIKEIPYLRFPALSRIKLSTIPSAITGSPRIDVTFSVLLIARNEG